VLGAGSWQLEAGCWKLAAGSWKLAAGGWLSEEWHFGSFSINPKIDPRRFDPSR
jgi:hypothetical protein